MRMAVTTAACLCTLRSAAEPAQQCAARPGGRAGLRWCVVCIVRGAGADISAVVVARCRTHMLFAVCGGGLGPVDRTVLICMLEGAVSDRRRGAGRGWCGHLLRKKERKEKVKGAGWYWGGELIQN